MTETHKKNIGKSNSIALKGHKINENQLKGLEKGRKNYTKERYKKIVKTRKEKNNYGHSEETIRKIKEGIKKKFPNGRTINSGSFKKGHKLNSSVEKRKIISERFKKEKNPSWNNGSSFEPYSIDWTNTLRKAIKERDKYLCQICLLEGTHIHHIDYNKKNNNTDNLITLCIKCHGKTNFSRNYWVKFFENRRINWY